MDGGVYGLVCAFIHLQAKYCRSACLYGTHVTVTQHSERGHRFVILKHPLAKPSFLYLLMSHHFVFPLLHCFFHSPDCVTPHPSALPLCLAVPSLFFIFFGIFTPPHLVGPSPSRWPPLLFP